LADEKAGISLFVVADIRLYREGLADVLTRQSEITVVGTAAYGERALEMLRDLRPDVMLLDLGMDAGREIVRRAAEVNSETRVVVLALPESGDEIVAWAEMGIAGYVGRDAALEQLVRTIRSVARGETLVSPQIAATLFRRIASLAAERGVSTSAHLTSRENEVLRLVARGLSNKEIAAHLTIELPTVKNHVHNILEKLNVQRRGEAVAHWRAGSIARAD
jgi:DNA-binding NarL/FixJ family response regulator